MRSKVIHSPQKSEEDDEGDVTVSPQVSKADDGEVGVPTSNETDLQSVNDQVNSTPPSKVIHYPQKSEEDDEAHVKSADRLFTSKVTNVAGEDTDSSPCGSPLSESSSSSVKYDDSNSISSFSTKSSHDKSIVEMSQPPTSIQIEEEKDVIEGIAEAPKLKLKRYSFFSKNETKQKTIQKSILSVNDSESHLVPIKKRNNQCYAISVLQLLQRISDLWSVLVKRLEHGKWCVCC